MDLLKINVKVFREGKESWVHFCYVHHALKRKFETWANSQGNLSMWWLNKWSEEQFGIIVDTWEDLELLKAEIRATYKSKYPELYVDSNTDRAGWLRIWYTQNMEKELKKVGK